LAPRFVSVVVPAADPAAQITAGVDRASRIQEPRFTVLDTSARIF
jgi:hypothetical protein